MLSDRSKKRVVHRQFDVCGMCDLRDGCNVGELEGGIARCLDEHQLRLRPDCRSHQLRSRRIDKAVLNSQRTKNLPGKPYRSAIHHVAHHDVIARLEQREAQRRNRGHAGGKTHRWWRIFESAKRTLERIHRWICSAGIGKALMLPYRLLDVSCGL